MFTFQQFTIHDTHCAMKVGTDGVLLGAWADTQDAKRILDLGCGSGLIALMSAQKNRNAHITGIEIDAAATEDARANVTASPFADQIEIVCADALHYDSTEGRFDCIISNPPYYEEDLLPPSSTRAAARHTQGGGLTFAALLKAVDHLLDADAPQARFSVILPTQAVSRFLPLAMLHNLHPARRTSVVTRPGKPCKRTLLEFRRRSTPVITDELVLVNDQGGRSEAYNRLCGDFYLVRP